MPEDYNGRVYRKQGGDELVVADGGKITIEAGGSIENAGDTYIVTEPDDVTLEIDNDDKLAAKPRLAAGNGGFRAPIDHTDEGAHELIPAASTYRVVIVVAEITETIAGTTEPTFAIGTDGEGDEDAIGVIDAGTAGDKLTFAGILPAGRALQVTVTDGETGPAGKVQFTAIAAFDSQD